MPGTDRQWQGRHLTNTTGSLVQRAGVKPSANAIQIILMTAPGLDQAKITGPERGQTDGHGSEWVAGTDGAGG